MFNCIKQNCPRHRFYEEIGPGAEYRMGQEGSGVIEDFFKNRRCLVLFWIRGRGTVGGVEGWRERPHET